MAFSNFKSVIWSKFIQTELEKKCRLVEDCWTQFEGEAKQGARVKIIGVGAIPQSAISITSVAIW